MGGLLLKTPMAQRKCYIAFKIMILVVNVDP